MRRLKRADLPVDTAALARFLVGKTLVRDAPEGRTSGRIVEAEAYVPGDASGHAYVGEVDRNRSLFLRRGHAYVYFIYGMHFCVNVSGERPGIGAGVLLRALEPIEGVAIMQARRRVHRLTDLARGPGRLAEAMKIDRRLDGIDLCSRSPLWLAIRAAVADRPAARRSRSWRSSRRRPGRSLAYSSTRSGVEPARRWLVHNAGSR